MQNASALVTGTLGLNFPTTAEAMHAAVAAAREGPCQVSRSAPASSSPFLLVQGPIIITAALHALHGSLEIDLQRERTCNNSGHVAMCMGPPSTCHHACKAVLTSVTQVLVDVNWRPVFWDDHETAPQRIREYVDQADILKLSDDEAEFIYGVGHRTSLENPETVWPPESHPCIRSLVVCWSMPAVNCGQSLRWHV